MVKLPITFSRLGFHITVERMCMRYTEHDEPIVDVYTSQTFGIGRWRWGSVQRRYSVYPWRKVFGVPKWIYFIGDPIVKPTAPPKWLVKLLASTVQVFYKENRNRNMILDELRSVLKTVNSYGVMLEYIKNRSIKVKSVLKCNTDRGLNYDLTDVVKLSYKDPVQFRQLQQGRDARGQRILRIHFTTPHCLNQRHMTLCISQ